MLSCNQRKRTPHIKIRFLISFLCKQSGQPFQLDRSGRDELRHYTGNRIVFGSNVPYIPVTESSSLYSYTGLGIYDTMQLVNSDVATICTGLAASMGAVLLTAGAKGKRSALPHSRVMIHQPLGGAQGQASDIEITAREIMKTKRELYEILSAHSGVALKKIEKDADRDYWLSAREAKEYGLIDEVLSKRGK